MEGQNKKKIIWMNLSWNKCFSNLSMRGPNFDKFEKEDDAKISFDEMVIWASNYWNRAGKCSMAFHQQIFDQFEGLKKEFKT